MPLAIDVSVCISEDCKSVGFSDSTGTYNITTNPTGYRTTNLPEITRVQTVAQGVGASQVTGGDYFRISDTQTNYYIWFDLDNGSANPSAANVGRTGIEVNIATGDTAATVATNLAAAINAFTFTTGGFTATVLSDLVTITNVEDGATTDAVDGVGTPATNFTFTIVRQGVWDDVGINDVSGAFIEYEVAGVTYSFNTFNATTAGVVDITTDAITVTAHGLAVRDRVILTSANTSPTLPGGLSINTVYYIINVGANTIALASSALNATAGTRINLTSTGSGVVTIKHNVINIFPTLPNTAGTSFAAVSSDLRYTTSTSFPDGVYTIRYVITGNGGGTAFTNEVTREFLNYCGNKCCVYNMIAAIPEANCSCNSESVDRALFAYTMLQALKNSAQSGQETRAININATLAILCKAENCSNCQ